MKLKVWACSVAVLWCTHVMALPPEDFTKAEYQISTGLGNTLSADREKLTDDFKTTFSFIRFKDKRSEKLITYLDTSDRALKEQLIQIRVREHVTKPSKSKVTVKLRASDPEGFGDIKDFSKAEIDYNGSGIAYSVSYDLKYSPEDISVKNVDIAKVIEILKSNPQVWNIVQGVLEKRYQDLRQTLVMRAFGWEGRMTEKQYEKEEIDFQVWASYHHRPHIEFAEFSFKGKTKKHQQLSRMHQSLIREVRATGLQEGAHQESKTEAVFNASKAFQ